MHIKRYEAATMLEAVQQVKAELGPDALILSTRTTRKQGGAFGLFGRDVVEITAAVDRTVRRGAAAADDPATRRAPEAAAPTPKTREVAGESRSEALATRALVEPLEAEVRELRRAVERLSLPSDDESELSRRVAEMQRTTADLAKRWLPGAREPDGARFSSRLLEVGFSARHAFALGEEASREASLRDVADAGRAGRGLRPVAEDRVAQRALRDALARRLDERMIPPRDDEPASIDFFVGPTGVGKTTTLAKIAARSQRNDQDVCLVTTDTWRIGAEEQLRTYATLLDVPFDVAGSDDALAAHFKGRRGRRVLVDTAGRSRRDPEPVVQLARWRERFDDRARFHLVLSATTKEDDLRGEIARYAPLRPDSVIVTKLDESDGLGNVGNLLLDADSPPLSWLTAGQRVPEDLSVPDPRELATVMIGGAR